MLGNTALTPFSISGRAKAGTPAGLWPLALQFTATPQYHLAAPGTTLGTLVGRTAGSTITADNFNIAIEDDAELTLEMGSLTLNQRFIEPQRFLTRIRETLGPNDRYTDVLVHLLPDGVAFGDPWTPYVYDGLVRAGFQQEDLAEGPVSTWESRGWLNPAATAPVGKEPTKLAGTDGVEFEAGTDQNMSYGATDEQACYHVRGRLTIFRVDKTTGGQGRTLIASGYAPNGTAFETQGAIRHAKYGDQLRVIWRDATGANEFTLPGYGLTYSEWIMVMHWHVDGKLYCRVNGGPTLTADNINFTPNRCEPSSSHWLGHASNLTNGGCTFAIDCRLDLSGELSDAIIYKLEKWGAERVGITLPVDHAYFSTDPEVDEADFPVCIPYFNFGEWRRVQDIRDNRRDFTNRGNNLPASVTEPFSVCVFKDDYRADSLVEERANSNGIWYCGAQGFAAGTVGVNATVMSKSYGGMYTVDTVAGTVRLRAIRDSGGSNRASAMSTVNMMDNGITFRGAAVYKSRAKHSDGGGRDCWFPCILWAYGNNRAKSPVGPSLEWDGLECAYPDSDYLNSLSLHCHEGISAGYVGSINGRPASGYSNYKLGNFRMDPGVVGPSGIDYADLQYHDQVIVMDDDMIYDSMDGLELYRAPIPRHLNHERWQLNMSQPIRNTTPPNNTLFDVTVKSIEVWKKPADLARYSAPFTARPTVSGVLRVGHILTCTPNAPGQCRFEWYHDDGYPLFTQPYQQYVIQASDAGKRLRCKVITVGHYEKEEAWAELTGVIAGGTGTVTSMDLNFAAGTFVVNGVSYPSFAAASAAVPGLTFTRSGFASHTLIDGTTTRYVPWHTMRTDSTRGLLYQPGTFTSQSVTQTNFQTVGAAATVHWVNGGTDGPSGVGTASACYEMPVSSNSRETPHFFNGIQIGTAYAFAALVKAGLRDWLSINANGPWEPGSGDTYYNIGAGTVGSVPSGITASLTELSGFPDWYLLTWQSTGRQATDGRIQIHPRLGNGDLTTYLGDDSAPAYYMDGWTMAATSRKIPQIHYAGRVRRPETLQVPLSGTRTATLTLYNYETGAQTTQVIPGVSGDYVLPVTIEHPFIKRYQIS